MLVFSVYLQYSTRNTIMEKGATVKLVYDPRTSKTKVRVTFNRQPRLFSTLNNDALTKTEFENTKLKKTKEILLESESALTAAQDICNELGAGFSFPKFTRMYRERLYGNKTATTTASFEFVAARYINNLSTVGSKNIYRTAANWLLRFKRNMLISDIDQDTVKDLIAYIKERSKTETGKELSENSLRIYLRSLRAITGYAEQEGIIKNNPFAHIKGQPLSSITREKGALNDEELSKFLKYTPCNTVEKFGKDMFLLSLYLCGANIGDIFSFRNKNIVGNEIQFTRRKTRKTNIIIGIPLIPAAESILLEYGHIDCNKSDEYILPFLSHCDTEISINNKIHDIVKRINKGLKSICQNIGIRTITTYTARHTYASFAQDTMTAEQIQKFLGHTSSRTTQVYLGSISQTVKDKNRDLLESLTQM